MNQVAEDRRPAHVPLERFVDFDIYHPFIESKDFHASWKALQDAGLPDVVGTPHNAGHWMVLRGPLVARVLPDYENFSNHTVLVPKDTAGEAYRLLPLSLDPPDHAPFRRLLAAGLSPQAVKRVESSIRNLAISTINGFRDSGACDFVKDFAEQLPLRIFLQIVELPIADLPKLKHLADQFTRPDGSLTYAEVGDRFKAYIDPIIQARRGGDGSDMLSCMINGEVDGRPLTDEEAGNLCIQVLVGGLDTVADFLSFVMWYLARNAESRRILRDNPERLPIAVVELARRYPLVTVGRELRHDFTFEGASLKQGEVIMAPTILHGLDEHENPDPMTVGFSRADVRHSTFGSGSHMCPGQHLARTETRIVIEEWLRRIPEFEVAPGERVTFTGGIVGSVDSLPLVWDVAGTNAGD